jgi:hypothetical protein
VRCLHVIWRKSPIGLGVDIPEIRSRHSEDQEYDIPGIRSIDIPSFRSRHSRDQEKEALD